MFPGDRNMLLKTVGSSENYESGTHIQKGFGFFFTYFDAVLSVTAGSCNLIPIGRKHDNSRKYQTYKF